AFSALEGRAVKDVMIAVEPKPRAIQKRGRKVHHGREPELAKNRIGASIEIAVAIVDGDYHGVGGKRAAVSQGCAQFAHRNHVAAFAHVFALLPETRGVFYRETMIVEQSRAAAIKAAAYENRSPKNGALHQRAHSLSQQSAPAHPVGQPRRPGGK